MDEVVTLQPWSPWPLVIPAALLVAAIVVSIMGSRRRVKPLREAGYVVFIVAAFGGLAMWWSLSSMWDTGVRQDALIGLGYEHPTFSAGTNLSGGELPPIAWQAERADGTRVNGVLLHEGGDRWRVRSGGVDDDD